MSKNYPKLCPLCGEELFLANSDWDRANQNFDSDGNFYYTCGEIESKYFWHYGYSLNKSDEIVGFCCLIDGKHLSKEQGNLILSIPNRDKLEFATYTMAYPKQLDISSKEALKQLIDLFSTFG